VVMLLNKGQGVRVQAWVANAIEENRATRQLDQSPGRTVSSSRIYRAAALIFATRVIAELDLISFFQRWTKNNEVEN